MENEALIESFRKGDYQARERLIIENTGLVWSIVKRFLGRGYDAEDLFQIGSIGLIKAIDRFDLNYDVKFSTYAVPMIAGELKRFLRDDGILKVSRSIKENAIKIKQTMDEFERRNGREATIGEIAMMTSLSKEEVVLALDAEMNVESLYKTVYGHDGKSLYLMDKVAAEGDEKESVINKITISSLIDELDSQEKDIIILRYYEEKTQTEIAKKLGISQVQVSRMEKRILLRMRERLFHN